MTHTKSTRYIARNDYAAVVNGIEICFSDTAFGAEIIANDYVSAQIELATRAADGAKGATTMTTYTIAATLTSTLAKRMAEVSHVAYAPAAQGEWYAVDTDGDGVLDDVAHAQTTRQFNPWNDAAVAIPIEDCFDHDGNDFSWGEEDNDDFESAASWAHDNLLDTVVVDEA